MKRFVKKLARPGIEPQKEQENGELSVPSTGGVASASTPPNFVDGAIDKDPTQTRLGLSRQKVLDASAKLTESLDLYHAKDAPWAAVDLSNLDFSSRGIVVAIEQVLVQQRNEKPNIASKIGAFLGKIYPLASLTLGLGAAAAEGAAFLPIKGIATGLSLLYSIAEQEGTRSEDFAQQLERISYQALRVAEVQDMHYITTSDLLLEKSMDLMAAVIQFLNSAILFFQHGHVHKATNAIFLGPKIYADGKAALGRAIAEYDQALLLEVTLRVLAMGSPAAVAPEEPSDRRKLSGLLAWLSSAHGEVEMQFANNCEIRASGTLQWVFECEEFKSWRLQTERVSTNRALWFNGVPGVGKSVIAAYIVQALKAQYPDAIVLYFFCKAGESRLDNLESIIRTMAAQLAQVEPVCRERLQKLKDDDEFKPRSTSDLFASIIERIIDGLSRQIFVVIDGLDECFNNDNIGQESGHGSVTKFLKCFEKLHVRLLISSRPTTEITPALQFGFKKTLTFEDSREDIENYVAMRVSQSRNLQKGFRRVTKEPGRYVAEKSNGNFLWVSVMLNLLEGTPSAKAFQTALETVPRAIGGVYDRVLDRLDSAGTLEVAMAILECVIFSLRPMTIAELHVATGLMSDEILDLQGCVEADCGSFLALVPGKNGPSVHIVHETFRGYIMDPSNPRSLQPARSHARITVACLACLCKPESDIQEEEDFDLDCLRDYATENWPEHLRGSRNISPAADSGTILVLLIAIHDFLQDQAGLQDWMRHSVFLRKDGSSRWNLGIIMADIYDELHDWISADLVTSVLDPSGNQGAEGQCPAHVAQWREVVCKGGSRVLAEVISNNFAKVWLNTNWVTYRLATIVFSGALELARILQLAGDPMEEENRVQWPPGFGPEARLTSEQMSKPGWTWRYPSSISTRWMVRPEQLARVAASGGLNVTIGVQAGNYAIGQHFARTPHCIQNFQIAIEESPERWYLHEGLGHWYEWQGDDVNAVKSYEKAMKLDPETPPECTEHYYTLMANIKSREGDVAAAEDAFRQGAMTNKDWDGMVYWNRMAKLHEEAEDWEAVKRVYREAIEEHPAGADHHWKSLADAYGKALDWRGRLGVYLEAIQRNPEHTRDYEDGIKALAMDLANLELWDPAFEIYAIAIEQHPSAKVRFQRKLAQVYLAKGGPECWLKASSLLEAIIREGEDGVDDGYYYDLSNCYLGLGEFSKYHAALAQRKRGGNASSDCYMVAGDFQNAIQALRSHLTWLLQTFKNYPESIYQADDLMELHMELGLCYEALGRDRDANTSFATAVNSFQKYADEVKDEILNRGEDSCWHRSDARPLYRYALMLEKLGRLEEAKEFYYRADFVCDITTFVGDDEILTSEAKEIKEALERVTKALENEGGCEKTRMLDLLDKVGDIRLQRKICCCYRADWWAHKKTNAPRYRGGCGGYAELFLKDKHDICPESP